MSGLVLLGLAAAGAARAAEPGLAELLLDKGQITEAEYQRLKPGEETVLRVRTDDGFRLTTADGSWLQLGVLVQFDVARYADDRRDLNDGSEFRRFRPYLMGQFGGDWFFRSSFDVVGGGEVVDAYVSYRGYQPLSLTFGNFVQPNSLESVSSDKYNAFLERALPFAFAISRAPGAAIAGHGAHWTASLGVFGEPPAVEPSGDEGGGVTARLTWAPFTSEGRSLHTGVSSYLRQPSQDNAGPGQTTLRFRAKPETSVMTPRLVDTGPIAGAEDYRVLVPEFGATWGALFLQGEYLFAQVRRDAGSTLDFRGWYAQAVWAPTGEVRPYRADRGVFDGIRPRRELGRDGGRGGWELAARLSELDLSDRDIDGGRLRDLSLGVNWFPNNALRVSVNLVKVLDVSGGPNDGDEPTVYQLRLQLGY